MLAPRLPKDLLADPRHEAVQQLLNQGQAPLWERGNHSVPTVALTARLAQELRRDLGLGFALLGLEETAKELAREQKGLDALAAKSTEPQSGPRISRVLFVADDAAERFYRECDSLLTRYGQRLLVCRITTPGEELGLAIAGRPKLMKAVLITDKKAASRALLALLPPT